MSEHIINPHPTPPGDLTVDLTHMSPAQLLQLDRELCDEDLYHFNTTVMSFGREMPDGDFFQMPERELRPLCNWLQKPRPEDLRRFDRWKRLLILPRGTTKTSMTAGYIGWRLLRQPDLTVLWVSEEKKLANRVCNDLADRLATPLVSARYGNQRSERDWTFDHFTLASRRKPRKEPSVMTAGVDVPIQGWHFDIIVCDDLQGQTNNTPEGIEKVANYLNLLWPVLNPGGELIWVCTRWDFNDVAARILKEWEEGEGHWDALPVARGYLGATAWPGDEEFFQDVDGTCHFDTSLPIDDPKRKVFQSVLDSETCETLKKDPPIGMGIYNYSCQIENDPLPSKAATFDPNDFRYVPDWAPEDAVDPQSPAFDLLAGMTYYLGLDVASGEEEIKYGDDCAIHVLGVRGSGLQRQHFVVESIGGKWKPDETVDRLFTICGKWRPAAVGIETNAMQKTYKWFITKRMNDLGIYLPIRELKRGGRKTKSDEIRKMQPFYRAHSVFHFKSFRNTPLETQLIRFKPGSSIHDDYPDSLAMCFELIREGYQLNTERARERKAKQRQIRIRPRGRHVGWY